MTLLSIKVDTRAVTRALQDAQRQIPFATMVAVNDLAFRVREAENAAMTTIFKHPRLFTQRAVLGRDIQRATKANPTAIVSVRPEVAKYLAPYEFGGVHATPGRALLNPKDIRLDQYGQLPRNIMKRLAARPDIFIGSIDTKHGKVAGVWQRLKAPKRGRGAKGKPAQHLKLLIRFGEALPVHKQLGFVARGAAVVRAQGAEAMRAAVERALRTARP